MAGAATGTAPDLASFGRWVLRDKPLAPQWMPTFIAVVRRLRRRTSHHRFFEATVQIPFLNFSKLNMAGEACLFRVLQACFRQ